MRPYLLASTALMALLASACSHDQGRKVPGPGGQDACAGIDEAACIGRTGGAASRTGDGLSIRTGSGSTVAFTSQARACAEGIAQTCVVYRLEGFRPGPGPGAGDFVVAERHYGGMRYRVVDGRTGDDARVDNDRPRFSPSGARFVGVMSAEGRLGEPDLAIWSAGEAGPRPEWSHAAAPGANVHYEFLGWEGDDTVRLRVGYGPVGGGPNRYGAAAIVRGEAGWTLEKPSDCP